jgi:virginiamycin B lyase
VLIRCSILVAVCAFALFAAGTPASADDVVDLLTQHEVQVEISGSDIQSVDVRLRALAPVSAAAPLRVEIPAGTFFDSGNSTEQNMVGTETRTVVLTDQDWVDITLTAACASRPRNIPDTNDRFAVKRLPQQGELAKAAVAVAAAHVPYAVAQAAIWIVSDNASYADLGEVVETTSYNPYGGTRVIGENEAAQALQILAAAGIDVTRKRIWFDRVRIAQNVSDPALRQWLSSDSKLTSVTTPVGSGLPTSAGAGSAAAPPASTTVAITSSAAAGRLTEYAVSAGAVGPMGISSGPDGALWFTEFSANKIGRISTAGALTDFAIPTPGSKPQEIVAGPDGALWFVELAANKIGRVSTAGAFTEYVIPTPDSQPVGIVSGPDGALWFTENKSGKVGRVTTDGTVTEFALRKTVQPSGIYPRGIASGPDGALWFTEPGINKIGRITTAGDLTEYAIPSRGNGPLGNVLGSQPLSITPGPDGALWFTEAVGNKIGRITTAGVFSEYAVPTANGGPFGIAAGPDGALWFAENNSNAIGRITAAGTVTEFTLQSAGGNPRGIAPGADGALWFTDPASNKIGRLK